MDHRHSKVINGSLAVKAASVRVVSRRKQIENGSLSSVRHAAAACNVGVKRVRPQQGRTLLTKTANRRQLSTDPWPDWTTR